MSFSNSSQIQKKPLQNHDICPDINTSIPILPLKNQRLKNYPSKNDAQNIALKKAHLDTQITALNDVFSDIIESSDPTDLKALKAEFSQLRERLDSQKGKNSKKDLHLKDQLDKLDKAFCDYQTIQNSYQENILKRDQLSHQLKTLSQGPLYGLTEDSIKLIEEQFSLLDELVNLSNKVGVDSLKELVEAEINEVIHNLEDWEKSVQKGLKETLPNAIADYNNLLNEPTANEPIKALIQYHNRLLAKQRVIVLQKWPTKINPFLDIYREPFLDIQIELNIAKSERFTLPDLDKASKNLNSQIKPLLEKQLPVFELPSSDKIDELKKELDSSLDAYDSFHKESLLLILEDPTLNSWEDFIIKKVKENPSFLFESLPIQEKSYLAKFCSWLGTPIHNILHAEEWSDTTKDLVYRVFALMQLSAQGINYLNEKEKVSEKAKEMQKQVIDSIPDEVKEGVEKDTSFLGSLQWNQIKDGTKLLKKIPGGDAFAKKMMAMHKDEAPSKEEFRSFLDEYQLTRLIEESPISNPYKNQMESLQDGFNLIHSTITQAKNAKEDLQNNLNKAFKTHNDLQLFLPAPKTALYSDKIIKLRMQAKLFSNALEKSIENTPQPTCPANIFDAWEKGINEKCYAIEDLEKQMSTLINEMRVDIDQHFLSASEVDLDAFGNKHKNLIKQARLAKALDIENLEVPIPQGLTSNQVLNFLKKTAPEVFDTWENLKKLYESSDDKTSFLKTDVAKESLEVISFNIQNAFAKAGNDEATFSLLNLSDDFLSWIKAIGDKENYLMGRSTGAEDSRKAANAGGNLSVNYVLAKKLEFCKAIGNIVSSYFGDSSLQNRINAEINPFEEELLVPVTFQELIGEPIGGAKNPLDIPISLVAFSNEPLYVGDEKFRVMRLSATFGHGDGVVGNLGINTDTVLVLNSVSEPDKLYVLYDNQEKPTRLAPVYDESGKKVVLKKIKNPDQLIKKQVLSSDLIQRLYYWAVNAESYFEDEATDMEIVIKNNKIFPVQARPVNRKPLLPTYLDMKKIEDSKRLDIEEEEKNLIMESLKTEMLVVGKGSAFEIKNPDEILTASTLQQAEKLYVKGKHKLVIVYQSEPANSHPVVNFSSLGVPCLYAQKREGTESLLSKISEENSLVVCMQSASLNLWDIKQGELDDFISEGFIIHPAKIAISLLLNQELAKDINSYNENPEDVKDIITRIRAATTQKVALENLEILKKHLWLKNFKEQISNLNSELNDDNLKIIEPILKAASELDKKITKAFSEIESVLKSKDPDILKPLLHIKILETLLFSEVENYQTLNQYSVIKMQKSFATAYAIINYQKKLSHTAHLADILFAGDQSPNEEVFSNWEDFLISLESKIVEEKSSEEKKVLIEKGLKLKDIVFALEKTDSLPIFMTLFFKFEKTQEPIKTLDSILNLISHQDEKVIQDLLESQKKTKSIFDRLDAFANTKTFDQAFNELKNHTSNLYNNNAFDGLFTENGWEKSSPITKNIAIKVLGELVDLYDKAIKSMKASQSIDDNTKVKMFYEMLLPYFQSLKFIAMNLADEKTFSGKIESINTIEKALSNERSSLNISELYPSDDFVVVSATLGQNFKELLMEGLRDTTETLTELEGFFDTDWKKAKTLEDIFTLIHQDHLVINSYFNSQFIDKETFSSSLPKSLVNIINVFKSQSDVLKSQYNDKRFTDGRYLGFNEVKPMSLDINQKQIIIKYNIPLRIHNTSLTFIYDRKTGAIAIEFMFFGDNQDNRWLVIKECSDSTLAFHPV